MAATGEHSITDVGGIRVVTEEIPSVRSVSLGVWMAVGSRDESEATRGYAHFLEHLLFKGNEQLGAEDISRYFDAIGSDANAATTKEYTVVHSRVIDRHVERSLEVLASMVLAPGFDPDELDSERQVILEEIAMYNDSPSDVVHELVDALVFEGHPLGLPIVGTVDTIERATTDGLAGFHDRCYVPGSIIVSAAGKVDHAALVEQVREQFLPRLPQGVGGRSAVDLRTAQVPHASVRAGVVHKDTEQVHLCIAAPGLARSDPRRYAGAVLDTILGSTPSSRLFCEVREQRGLAYSVYSFVSHYSDTGQVGVYVAVRPDRVADTLDVLARQIDEIRTSPPDEEEVERARDHLEGRLLLSMESTTVRGNRLGASLVTGMPIDPVDVTVERIRAVTAEDVRALAADLLAPERLVFAAVAEDVAPVRDAASAALGIDRACFVEHEAVVTP